MSKNVVFDFEDLLIIPRVFTKAVNKSIRASIKRGFKRGTIAGRKVLRQAIIKKGASQTTFSRDAANKRVRRRTWAKDGLALGKMHARLDIANWPEHMAHFATKAPKMVKKKKGRRYFKPQISNLGKKGVALPSGGFQPMKWQSARKEGGKRSSLSKGKAMRMIMKRTRKGRKPLENSKRGDRAIRTSSMYEILFDKSPIGRKAAQVMFKMTVSTMDNELRRRLKKNFKNPRRSRAGR